MNPPGAVRPALLPRLGRLAVQGAKVLGLVLFALVCVVLGPIVAPFALLGYFAWMAAVQTGAALRAAERGFTRRPA